jgi:hypothetical protein
MNLLFEHFSPQETDTTDYSSLVISEIRGLCDMTYADWMLSGRLDSLPSGGSVISNLLNPDNVAGLRQSYPASNGRSEALNVCFKDFLRIPAIILATDEDFI